MTNQTIAEEMTHRLGKTKAKSSFLLGSSDKLLSIVKYWHSTGCYPLDAAIGGGNEEEYGGIPGGRILEFFGDESTGKSLVALHIIAEYQKKGGIALLLDVEATNTPEFMQRLGVDIDNLVVVYPKTVEEVYEACKAFLAVKRELDEETGEAIPGIIVWDSIAATTAMTELDAVEAGGLEKVSIAPHARAMSKMLRLLPQELNRTRTTALFVNQTRVKIGVMFGDDVATSGGKALKFHCSLRVQLVDVRKYKQGGEVIGHEIKAVIVKNKVDRPFRQCKFPVLFDGGIDNAVACFWYLRDLDIMQNRGAWYYIDLDGEEMKFQKTGWREVFEAHEDQVREIIMCRTVPDVEDEEEIDEDDT